MRMKRLLSLMLAVLMFASMTISVSAVSKVYYRQDFSGYNDVSAAVANMSSLATDLKTTNVINSRETNGKNMLYKSTNGGFLSSTYSALTTDDSGVNWFTFCKDADATTKNGNFIVVPDETWDYLENDDEMFIISYDFIGAPLADTTANQRNSIYSLWTDGDGADAQETMVSISRIVAATTNDPIETESQNKILVSCFKNNTWYGNNPVHHLIDYNTKVRIATGYKFVDGLDYARKTTGVDGNLITESIAAAAGTNARPILGGFGLVYSAYIKESISNIMMYTVPKDFKVVSVNPLINTTDKLTVKFSHPVYGTANIENIVINDVTNGTSLSNSNYVLSEVKTVIDPTTKEYYSYFDVTFKFGLNPDSSYEVVVPNTIKDELGITLGSNNTAVFATKPVPLNSISLSGNKGLDGTGNVLSNFTPGVNMFTATASAGNARSFLLVGIYIGESLVSYGFATVNENESVSLAADIQSGMTVKALSCGDLVNLTAFSSVANMTEATE